MSFLKKLFSSAVRQSPTAPLVEPALPHDALLEQYLKDEREREIVRLGAAYRNVFALLTDRYITTRLDRNKLFDSLRPPEPVVTRRYETLRILPSPDCTLPDMERFWNSLRHINQPLIFDLVSKPGDMYFRFSFPRDEVGIVEQQFEIHFPTNAVIRDEEPETLSESPFHCFAFVPTDGTHFFDGTQAARDPYAQLIGLLDNTLFDENLILQVVCCPLPDQAIPKLCDYLAWEEPGIPLDALRPGFEQADPSVRGMYWYALTEVLFHEPLKQTPEPFAHDYLQSMSNHIYKIRHEAAYPIADCINQEVARATQLFAKSREMQSRLRQKQPPWVAAVNVFCNREEIADTIHSRYLHYFETPQQTWTKVRANSSRDALEFLIVNWNMVSTNELTMFAHFPTKGIESDRLETTDMKQAQPPTSFLSGELLLGQHVVRSKPSYVFLPSEVRDRHLYIIGKSGTGKSTLIFNAALQDILRGDGVAVIDPHGDLVATGENALLHYIPEQRIKDTIYLNASDKSHPLCLNLLHVENDEELDLLASNLQTSFRRLSDSWGERMDNLLRFSLHTLVQTPGTNFFDLKRLLQNAEYRKRVVTNLNDERLIDFWTNDFPSYKDSVQPIISRIGKFMLSPLYGMLSQSESRLNLTEMIENKKIFLVNLGGIGEEDAQLIGSLLVSQLQLAIMQRSKVSSARRHPYYLYVDEFQNFTSRSFAKILSEARKYGLCLTLAHQFMGQLSEAERDAIFGNVGTMVMFGVGDKDAQALRHQIGQFEPKDLLNLPKFHTLCRPDVSKSTFALSTLPPIPLRQSFAEIIINQTRLDYSVPPQTQKVSPPTPPKVDTPEAHTPQAPMSSATSALVETPPELIEPHLDLPMGSEPIKPPLEATVPDIAPSLGRGGKQHRYLQQLLKRVAEDKGFKAVIEDPVLMGTGSIDLSLSKGEQRVACEISISSTCDHEIKNINKCLAAGFDQVVLLSSDRRSLGLIEKAAGEELDDASLNKVMFFVPEEFIQFLEEMETADPQSNQTVRGYSVKVKYKRAASAEQAAQRKAIAHVIVQALKRLQE